MSLALPTLVAATLLVPTAPAIAADGPGAPPRDSSPAAARALDHALDALSGARTHARTSSGTTSEAGTPEHTDATLALTALHRQLPSLDRADRTRAERIFARPDGSPYVDTADVDLKATWDTNETAAAQIKCSTEFCVHWVPAGTLDDSGAESRHGASLAAVDKTLLALDESWAAEVDRLGYLGPESDGDNGAQGDVGLDGKVDAYLSDIYSDDSPMLGYAVPENATDRTGGSADGYMVLDNDYAGASTKEVSAAGVRQVTAAHEFFHLIQFGYDVYENAWFAESTAAWMEEQVYDDVNDNRSSISYGSLVWTQQPLDTHNGGPEYGTWVFHELYTHMLHTDDVVREAWEFASRGGDVYNQASADARVNFRWALDKALALHGWSLARAFSSFGGSSLAPRITRDGVGVYYPEGKEGSYPSAHIYDSWFLSTSRRSLDWRFWTLKHWGGAVAEFKPNSTLSGAWKLGIKIDNPATQSAAYAITFYKDGTAPRLMSLTLNSSGDASFTVPFDYRKVARVAIYQGNTSPSDGRKVQFRASTFK